VTPTGCSVTSTAAVSTTGVTGCRTSFRAAFFAGVDLDLALATVRLAALDTLRALPRAVAAFLFCRFDCFLRLAKIDPQSDAPHSALMPDH
jgi:hypothetical protein